MSADSKDEIVRILVREGRADLLGRDESSGNTALHTCVIFNRVRLAKLLVELWAEVQEKRKAFWNARNAALDGDTRDDFGYKRDEPPLSFKLGDAKNYDQLTPATLCAKEYSNQGELFSGLWEWELVPNWRYGNIVRVNYNLDGVDNIVDIVKGRVGNSETVFDLMTFHDVHKILGTTQSLQALVKLKWKHYGKYAVYRRGMFAFFYVVNLAFLIIFRRDTLKRLLTFKNRAELVNGILPTIWTPWSLVSIFCGLFLISGYIAKARYTYFDLRRDGHKFFDVLGSTLIERLISLTFLASGALCVLMAIVLPLLNYDALIIIDARVCMAFFSISSWLYLSWFAMATPSIDQLVFLIIRTLFDMQRFALMIFVLLGAFAPVFVSHLRAAVHLNK